VQPDKTDPNWLAILLDQREDPLIMIARLGEPYGWIKLLCKRTRPLLEM
jgi:hypothetical protein